MKNSYRAAILFAVILCVGLIAYYGQAGNDDTSAGLTVGDGPVVATPDDAPPVADRTPTRTTDNAPATGNTGRGTTLASTGQSSTGSDRRANSIEDIVGDIINSIPSADTGTTPTSTGATPTTPATDSRRPTLSGGSSTSTGTVGTNSTAGGTSTPPATSTGRTDVRPISADTATPSTGTGRTSATPTTSTPPRTPAVTPATTTPPRVVTPPPATTATAARTYTIRSGDTFSSIAEDEFGSQKYWFEIAQANPTVDPAKLKIGQVIRLPRIDTTSPSTSTDVRPDFGPGSGQEYIVRPEDTLSSIARQFYNDPDQWRMLHDLNRTTIGSDPNRLKVGMKLRIPPPQTGAN